MSPLHYLHLLQRPAQCRVLFIKKFILAGFFKYFSRLYSLHYTGPSRVTSPILDTGHVPGPLQLWRLESQLCNSRCHSLLRIVILSGASPSQDRFKLPATVLSLAASRDGLESCAATCRSSPGCAAARHWQPTPYPWLVPLGVSDLAKTFRPTVRLGWD